MLSMRFRKLLFWMHLVAGIAAGVVIFTMSVSGLLLAYERQLVAWDDSRAPVVVPAGNPQRLAQEKLIARALGALPAGLSITKLTIKAEPRAPMIVSLSDGSTVLVDPYAGAILKRSVARQVFHTIEDVHRALALGLVQHRSTGTAITGVCNAAFLFLVLSGVYLWLPRRWSRSALRAVLWFDPRKRGKARDFNWHNVIGFWSSLPLLVIVLSGVLMSYPALMKLAEKGTASQLPSAAAPAQTPPRSSPRVAPTLDSLFAAAQQKVPRWQAITMRFSASDSSTLGFSIATGEGVRPDHWSRLTLDTKTGAAVRWQSYESYGAVRKVLAWGRWLHTGEALGIAGQSVAALVSAGAALLVWTGLALAWRRLFRRAKAAPRQTMRQEPAPEHAAAA